MFLLKKLVPGGFWEGKLIKRILVSVFLSVFFASLAFAINSPEEKAFNEVKKLIQKGKIENGEKSARAFINRFPESDYVSEIKFFLAESETSFTQALKKYETIIKNHPRSRFARLSQVRIAEYYFTRGNFRQARLEWGKYFKNFPDGEDVENAFLSIGTCYYQEKGYNQAVDYFKEFIRLYPESVLIPQARFNLALAYLNGGKIDQAKVELEKLLEKYPDWENKVEVYRRLSGIYLAGGETKKSKEILAKLEKSSPVSKDAAGYSYAVQVGAFSDKKRADKLAGQLKKKEYKVYLVSVKKSGTIFYRVRVGKFQSKDEAGKMAERIEIDENLPAVVVTKN